MMFNNFCNDLGNKADCQSSERMVRREDGERLAREHTVAFMETSAKTGQNVELAFMAIARYLIYFSYFTSFFALDRLVIF